MMKTATPLSDQAAYGIPEASMYLRLNSSTLRSWTTGNGLIHPPEQGYLSFNNLLEGFMLKALRRRHKFSMQSLRPSLGYVAAGLGINRPLLDARFATDGLHLFCEHNDELINVSEAGQRALQDIISLHLTRIERDSSGAAIRLYPFVVSAQATEPKSISISPQVAFGRSVIAGTGISTEVIAGRFAARESIADLADEYGIDNAAIEDAIRWEKALAKAA